MNVKSKPLYNAWRAMRRRCNSPGSDAYRWYGGNGVKICSDWDDFYKYQDWCFKNGWKKGMVVSRKNDIGDYSPENCEIISHSENSRISAERMYKRENSPLRIWHKKKR